MDIALHKHVSFRSFFQSQMRLSEPYAEQREFRVNCYRIYKVYLLEQRYVKMQYLSGWFKY